MEGEEGAEAGVKDGEDAEDGEGDADVGDYVGDADGGGHWCCGGGEEMARETGNRLDAARRWCCAGGKTR